LDEGIGKNVKIEINVLNLILSYLNLQVASSKFSHLRLPLVFLTTSKMCQEMEPNKTTAKKRELFPVLLKRLCEFFRIAKTSFSRIIYCCGEPHLCGQLPKQRTSKPVMLL
jgi:hypothetical protein